jgi:hypothetical protein
VMKSPTCSWPKGDLSTWACAQPCTGATDCGRESCHTCNFLQLHLLSQRMKYAAFYVLN